MAKELTKDTKTWKNLETAFAGECQARVKYEYYASKAKKDGYEQMADIFTETSLEEKGQQHTWHAQHTEKDGPETAEHPE